MRKAIPVLRHVYGLTWDEIDSMPPAELEAYLDHLDQLR